ncbi:MAG: glutamate--tRNA ligase family protein [Alphaproteobacteria bacterium]
MMKAEQFITEDFDGFIADILAHDPVVKIASADGDVTLLPEFQKVADLGKLVRAPQFLIVTQGARNSMVILDEDGSINEMAVGLSRETQVKAETAEDSFLKNVGFSSFKHPMFDNSSGFIHRFYIDAYIAKQHEMYPDSLIILPAMRGGREVKIMCRIDAFMQVMHARFGRENCVNANVAKRRWQSDVLRQHILREQKVSTRFAPSPTGSMHLGSVRTALMSLLTAMSMGGDFTLRIDDTNQEKSQEKYVQIIRDDLAWLGFDIDESRYFRQSDSDQIELYKGISQKLEGKEGYTEERDRKIYLKRNISDVREFSLISWRGGPQYFQRMPDPKPPSEKDDYDVEEDFVLRDVGADMPRYKNAGAFDDLSFTRVFRDYRQADFTMAQAYIQSAMHHAGVEGIYPNDTVYLFLALVAGAKGQQYSKSKGSDSIADIRENNLFLPEAVICGILMTIIPRKVQEEEGFTPDDIFKCCAEEGIKGVLEHVASRFSLDWVEDGLRKQYVYFSKDQLPKIERKILEAMPYERFVESVRERLEVDARVIDRLYAHRSEFAGWKEISDFAGAWSGEHIPDFYLNAPEPIRNAIGQMVQFSDCPQSWVSEYGLVLRAALFGSEDGPAISVLLDCVPSHKIEFQNDYRLERNYD